MPGESQEAILTAKRKLDGGKAQDERGYLFSRIPQGAAKTDCLGDETSTRGAFGSAHAKLHNCTVYVTG